MFEREIFGLELWESAQAKVNLRPSVRGLLKEGRKEGKKKENKTQYNILFAFYNLRLSENSQNIGVACSKAVRTAAQSRVCALL